MFTVHYAQLPGRPALGADGLVRALAATQPALSLDEARVLSGVAFRAYFLTPDDNHAYRECVADREWAWGSLDTDNYGVLESMRVHMDRDLREYPLPKPADLIALLRHELGAGRPVVGRLEGPSPESVIVTALDGPKGAAKASDAPAATGAVTIEDLTRFSDDGPRLRSLVTARPWGEPTPARRRNALSADVLTYAVRHASTRRELHFGEELFYASGTRAFDVAADALTKRWREPDTDAFDGFWRAWTADLRDGRAAAAAVLGARDGLGQIGAAYARVPDAVPETRAGFDWSDQNARTHIARALDEAAALDAEAVQLLAATIAGS